MSMSTVDEQKISDWHSWIVWFFSVSDWNEAEYYKFRHKVQATCVSLSAACWQIYQWKDNNSH